jgi:hypothetical protein
VNELVRADLGPGMVSAGFAEAVLSRAAAIDDPAVLYDAATSCAALAQKWNGHGAEKNEIKSAQMFVEIELGQRLGPNPGASGATRWNPHADSMPIPPQRVEEFRRYLGQRDFLLDLVRNGKRSRRSLLLALDLATADDTVTVEGLDLRAGDFRDVLGDIEPGTVALVLTDPPYPAEYLPLWSDMAKFATVALVDGGSLIAYCGQSILPEGLYLLGEHLRYWWTIALLHQHGTAMIPGKWVSAGWKPLLWFVKNGRRNRTMLADRIDGTAPRKTLPTGDTGDWAQGVEELAPIISALTAPGDLIVDPFAGSGTVGLAAERFHRRFVGADL